MITEHSRRAVLKGFGVAAGAALVTGGSGLITPATAQTADSSWRKSTSANGWDIPAGRLPLIAMHDIQGCDLTVSLREGDAGVVLAYLAQRFHYDVAMLERERGEIIGYSADRNVKVEFESNHLSGTALALYPELYPLGAKGSFWPHQVTAIRDILAELQGVVKWGGDMRPPQESMFFIDVPPDSRKLKQVAATLREWQITPGEGAGTQNVEEPARIAASKKLAKKQAR
ncbi:hypothetical protein [Streptomyces carminius]|uniref:hypothetical protein n=1 Tax=Streptomyces carminius TaxID=2665496 RepID=UPI0011B4A1B9|nr:hypothetical protein [Streptomyces carminius]